MFGRTVGAGRQALRLAVLAAAAMLAGAIATKASAETRTLRLYNLHTHEKASFDYKVNGRYDSSELQKINWFLRDWRKAKATNMDPRLLDLIWEAYRQSGSRAFIHVICGYRSPATNAMLRSRSSGVAKESQHTLGRALDFYIPDVPLKKMREIGLKMQVGGVGFYPRSGSPFVHFDVGNVRHWPRMNRRELLAVFPNGNTVHVPSDGKPLPGYSQALASYKARRSGSQVQVANARPSSGGGKSLISMLFGGGSGSEAAEDEADVATPSRAPVQAAPQPPAPVDVAAVVPRRRPSRDLPNGVSVPIPDQFDAGARSAASVAEASAVDIARVPVPTVKPARAARPEDAIGQSEVGSLIAAAEAELPQAKVAASQLAYAVPMPTDRPNFDALLKSKGKSDPAKPAVAALNSLAAEDRTTVAAIVPTSRPAQGGAAKAPTPHPGLVAASFKEKAVPAPRPLTGLDIASRARVQRPAVSGKGGRVISTAQGQKAIHARIEYASFIAEEGGAAEGVPGQHSALSEAMLARGFTLSETSRGAFRN
ncbi:DUF882 domain-containing protein [Jiella sp. MQZ9-1]|nr:DUF882 domain-containing protein [Jiella flava]MCD2471592.1 DUF882 domain-containing protein [Jiella flava]